jgi:hypothetical protein
MNIKQYILAFIGSGCLLFSGCSEMGLVGPTIQPDDDKITVYTDTFEITASTVKIDSLLAKTTYGYLGEIYDPLYGRLKSDYLSQFYCQEGYTFAQTPHDGKIDSITFHIRYTTWTGDAYTPMQVNVHPIINPLNKIYYSNINASDYCDMQQSWGSRVFTASNGVIVDSMLASSTSSTYIYDRDVSIRLPIELGQKIYDETVQNPSTFENQEAFNRFFPGVYVTTDYGSGTILHINWTRIDISYQYGSVSTSTGADTLLNAVERFMVSKDVIQLNRFENSNTEQLLVDNDEYTFLKTPAGIFTRLVIPAKEIKPVIEGRIVNNLALEIKYLQQEDWIYALAPPPYLLLLAEDSLRSFFENDNIENGITTYISTDGNLPAATNAGYNATSRTYSFRNIANLLNYHLLISPDEDLRLLLVPVNRTYQQSSSSSSYYSTTSSYYTTALSHYLAPAGVKLRKDRDFMKIAILSSKYINK